MKKKTVNPPNGRVEKRECMKNAYHETEGNNLRKIMLEVGKEEKAQQ